MAFISVSFATIFSLAAPALMTLFNSTRFFMHVSLLLSITLPQGSNIYIFFLQGSIEWMDILLGVKAGQLFQ